MRQKVLRVVAPLLSGTLLISGVCSSCSVKTARAECPCILELELSGGQENTVRLFYNGQKVHGSQGIVCFEGEGCGTEIEIPRDELVLSGVSGIHECRVSGDKLCIPVGEEMDEVYAFSAPVDSRGMEMFSLNESLHRQYAYVFLTIKGVSRENFPYFVRVSGNVCGMDLFSFEPLEGPFNVMVHPVIGELCRVCVPRQKDDSLELEFFDKNMTKIGEGDSPETIPIGKFIAREGYNWDDSDLSDIHLSVNFTRTSINIEVLPWKTTNYEDEENNVDMLGGYYDM